MCSLLILLNNEILKIEYFFNIFKYVCNQLTHYHEEFMPFFGAYRGVRAFQCFFLIIFIILFFSYL